MKELKENDMMDELKKLKAKWKQKYTAHLVSSEKYYALENIDLGHSHSVSAQVIADFIEDLNILLNSENKIS